MRKADFCRLISEIEKYMISDFNLYGYTSGVCDYLSVCFLARDDFFNLFHPNNLLKKRNSKKFLLYWLGDRCVKANVEKRLNFLRMFEQVALDEKMYKNY